MNTVTETVPTQVPPTTPEVGLPNPADILRRIADGAKAHEQKQADPAAAEGGKAAQQPEKKAAPAAEAQDTANEVDPGDEHPDETAQDAAPVETPTPAAELTDKEKLAKSLRADFGLEEPEVESDLKLTKPVAEFFEKHKIDAKKVMGIARMEADLDAARAETAKYKAQVDQLANLPQSLKNAQVAALSGEKDWAKHLVTMPELDTSKPFEEHDERSLVQTLSGVKFTKDEWASATAEDEEGDPVQKERRALAVQLAKTKYEALANERTSYLRNKAEADKARVAGFNASVETTMKNFLAARKSYGAFEPTIRKSMTPQGIASNFFDEKGNLTADAAEAMFWANKETRNVALEALLGQQKRTAKEEAQLEALSRQAERPKDKAGSAKTKAATPGPPKTNKETFLERVRAGQMT